MAKEIKHLLVIRLSAMGDVAMVVPVLSALIKQQPELKITVLTQRLFLPFFRDLENVSVCIADLKGKHKGILGLFKLSRTLKELEIDAVADLHHVLRSNILKFFFSIKPFIQINKGRKEKKKLVNGELFHQLKTTHQRYADVFLQLGFKIDLSQPIFPEAKPLSKELKPFFLEENKPVIGIAPFAQYDSKMYPLPLMAKLIAELSKNYKVVLFGGGNREVDWLDAVARKHEGVMSIAGKFDMNIELDVISNLALMLSMDSGNAHIAAFLGIKVVTIWGVTHPFAGFFPYNQPFNYGLLASREAYPEIPTSIYGNKYPESYHNVASSISISKIISRIETVLKE